MGEIKKEKSEEQDFVLEAPDGGWGYVIVLATVVIFGSTIIPMGAFGLIYGGFLKTLGDETTGTTMANGIFNTANSFTGLLANCLLAKFSYRLVGFIGAGIYLLGAVGIIFCKNLLQLIIFFGVIQGLGFGLLMPASLSAFNQYFNKRMTVMMSICQAMMIALSIAVPSIIHWSMHDFGFRGTLIGLAILSSLCIPAAATLQPVKKHMKKIFIQTINSTVVPIDQEKPLVDQAHHIAASQRSLHSHHARYRKSVVSLGDRFASITTLNDIWEEYIDEDTPKPEDKMSFWKSFMQSMDMSLLKDLKYLNISIGLSLCFTGDMAFISIIPLMMANLGFTSGQIATMISVFFGSDLASRILLTIVSSVVKFRSRMLILFTSVFIVIARTALVSNDTYMWKLVCLAILGFLRGFIQTPLPLVFSEEYQSRFASAFSLFMAVNGVTSLICAPLMSFVKALTKSDVMVCHILTVAYVICIVAWICEMTFSRKKNNEEH